MKREAVAVKGRAKGGDLFPLTFSFLYSDNTTYTEGSGITRKSKTPSVLTSHLSWQNTAYVLTSSVPHFAADNTCAVQPGSTHR